MDLADELDEANLSSTNWNISANKITAVENKAGTDRVCLQQMKQPQIKSHGVKRQPNLPKTGKEEEEKVLPSLDFKPCYRASKIYDSEDESEL